MLESSFKARVLERIKDLYPDVMVLKNDAGYLQGVPDWLFLLGPYWFSLEIKRSKDASIRPNQPYYVELMNNMSFSAFIYPENFDEIFDEIQRLFLK